jgi:hypothetical protein
MNGEFIEALEQIEREKGIPMASLVATVEAAMASAYRGEDVLAQAARARG